MLRPVISVIILWHCIETETWSLVSGRETWTLRNRHCYHCCWLMVATLIWLTLASGKFYAFCFFNRKIWSACSNFKLHDKKTIKILWTEKRILSVLILKYYAKETTNHQHIKIWRCPYYFNQNLIKFWTSFNHQNMWDVILEKFM